MEVTLAGLFVAVLGLAAWDCGLLLVGYGRLLRAAFRLSLQAVFCRWWRLCRLERVWVISIARLSALLRVHLQPIDVIVFDDPYMEILS